jgi:hypothetical protein
MPDWFEALNRDFPYQLTVMGQFAQAIVATKLANHSFATRPQDRAERSVPRRHSKKYKRCCGGVDGGLSACIDVEVRSKGIVLYSPAPVQAPVLVSPIAYLQVFRQSQQTC